VFVVAIEYVPYMENDLLGAHSKLGYFWASFDRLLDGNFHAHLAIILAQSLQRWPGPVAEKKNPVGPVTYSSQYFASTK